MKGVVFKFGGMKFKEDFTICELARKDFVLENTFLDYYRIKLWR